MDLELALQRSMHDLPQDFLKWRHEDMLEYLIRQWGNTGDDIICCLCFDDDYHYITGRHRDSAAPGELYIAKDCFVMIASEYGVKLYIDNDLYIVL